MRIGDTFTPSYWQNPVVFNYTNPAQQAHKPADRGIIVDISPQARAAYERAYTAGGPAGTVSPAEAASPAETVSPAEAAAALECATCASRTYQDVSDDSSVSFQAPTHISPGQSAAAVAGHEAEHVANEQARADREGYEIVSQTVTLHTSICPECKRAYVSGGTTRTISRHGGQPEGEDVQAV